MGARIDVDGVDEQHSVFVEVFAHQGRLKGSQIHKVARDALKLITLGRQYQAAQLVIAFGDSVAAAQVMGSSWLAEALRTWGVRVTLVELEEDVRLSLSAAQARQVMINPPMATGIVAD